MKQVTLPIEPQENEEGVYALSLKEMKIIFNLIGLNTVNAPPHKLGRTIMRIFDDNGRTLTEQLEAAKGIIEEQQFLHNIIMDETINPPQDDREPEIKTGED